MKPLHLICFVLCFIPFLSTAQIHQIETKNWEIWYEDIPISGEIRVGMTYDYSDENINPDSFYVFVPNISGNHLCVIITTRDGRYSAHPTFNLSGAKRGAINAFVLDSKFKLKLAQYKRKDISILCKFVDDCTTEPTNIEFASWEKTKGEMAYVFLNSEKKPFLEFNSKKNKDCNCKKIISDTNVAFNYYCSFPSELLDKYKTIDVVQRVRILDELTLNRYPIELTR